MFFKSNINKQLKEQAKELGACEKGLKNFEHLGEQDLINRYIHFVDFAIANNFPSNDFIRKNFDQTLLEHNNIYVDAKFERRNARQVVIVQGKSNGVLLYDGMTSADVYVRHYSEVTIDCNRLSKVFISVYDRAKVNVIQHDGASVYVYLHGGNCEVKAEGDVMTRRSAE